VETRGWVSRSEYCAVRPTSSDSSIDADVVHIAAAVGGRTLEIPVSENRDRYRRIPWHRCRHRSVTYGGRLRRGHQLRRKRATNRWSGCSHICGAQRQPSKPMSVSTIANSDNAVFDRHIAVNLRGAFYHAREAAKRLRNGRRIISFSSSDVNGQILRVKGGIV
jgi:NAD(P)-dependent dehydrogenase (short-subunit alcohol dehydrogenase family)